MTSTVSFKNKLKQTASMLKWELKSCAGTLTVYAILASVFLAIALTLCIVVNSQIVAANSVYNHEQFIHSIETFQFIGLSFIQLLTIVFSIVYTVKVFSYLHNKRQTDLYGSLPISRATLFTSKSISALLFSVIPALVFYAIIAFITFICGAEVLVLDSVLNTVLLAFSCVTAYGVISVCCGTTLNAIIMFLAISFAFPASVFLATGIVGGLFIGADFSNIAQSFLTTALSPMTASIENHPIYWCIFTVGCAVLGTFLARRRKAERAQESFAFYLPCHLVKLLISFLCGTFLGTLFGSLNVLGNGYLGFVFGFLLAGIPAFIIAHLIFYKGFAQLGKTSIALGILVVVVLAGIGLANLDFFGYNNYVPKAEDVKSAGFINSDYYYRTSSKTKYETAENARDDYTDSEKINLICSTHKAMLDNIKIDSSKKFQCAWMKMLGNINDNLFERCVISYKLNNGMSVTRYYDNSLFTSEYYDYTNELSTDVLCLKEYQQNYSAMMNLDLKDSSDFHMDITGNGDDADTASAGYYYDKGEDKFSESYMIDKEKIEKVLQAYRKDFEADTKDLDKALYCFSKDYYNFSQSDASYEDWVYCKANCKDIVCCIDISITIGEYDISKITSLNNALDLPISQNETFVVPKSYTNTINVLKELGVLNDNFTINGYSTYGDDFKMYPDTINDELTQ